MRAFTASLARPGKTQYIEQTKIQISARLGEHKHVIINKETSILLSLSTCLNQAGTQMFCFRHDTIRIPVKEIIYKESKSEQNVGYSVTHNQTRHKSELFLKNEKN